MDDLKDIQKTDSVSRFIDGHQVRTNPFGENRAGERAYRRAERLAIALHLLTNHIDPAETIRGSVRAESEALLRHTLTLRDDMRAAQSFSVTAVQSSVRHLISLVRILSVSGFVSMQNATTVIEALDELGAFLIASQRSTLSESIILSREDLSDIHAVMPQRSAPRPIRATKNTTDSPIGHVSVETTPIDNGQISVRSRNIIEVLRVGGAQGIRDIAANLPEYSEKMIQRELLELVSRGHVHKEGLKRWSRYSLAGET